MKTYVCQICGHIAFDEAPVDCPVCGMAIENFENMPDVIKKPSDLDNLNDMEKKHVPVINVSHECSLNQGDECIDFHVKIGEISHVMETEHFINFIDVYINKKYVTRALLTPKLQYPSAGFHLNVKEGVVSVIGHCNVHGYWRSKVKFSEKE
jgi:superoxide reductase